MFAGRGQIIGVVGLSGGGKSPILALIERFCDQHGGTATHDGTDVRTLQLGALRRHMTRATQEMTFFSCIIRENILLPWPHPAAKPDHDLQAAVRAAELGEVVASLLERLDTEVGNRGLELSGGQRQRIAIARAASSPDRASCICVVVDGAVEEAGTRNGLVARGGLYTEMLNVQRASPQE